MKIAHFQIALGSGALVCFYSAPMAAAVVDCAPATATGLLPVTITCSRASGSVFPVGKPKVTVTDAAVNVSTKTFTVRVSS